MLKGDSDAAAGFLCGEILMNGRSEYVGLLDKAEGLEDKGKKKTNTPSYPYDKENQFKCNILLS